jgi:hypothetical protein
MLYHDDDYDSGSERDGEMGVVIRKRRQGRLATVLLRPVPTAYRHPGSSFQTPAISRASGVSGPPPESDARSESVP